MWLQDIVALLQILSEQSPVPCFRMQGDPKSDILVSQAQFSPSEE